MHSFFTAQRKTMWKMQKHWIEFAKWRPTQNLLFGRLHFMIYTHNRFGRFVSFHSIPFCLSLALALHVWVCVFSVDWYVCAVNTEHVYTRCMCSYTQECLRFVWLILRLSLTRVSALAVDLVCRACLHVVSLAPTYWVLALLLLMLFYLSLALAPL